MNLCIVQARMGSSRLPGKVLREVNGKSILQNVVDRLGPASSIDTIVVATTTNAEDDVLDAFCKDHNIACYRGSDWDVLDRFYKCAQEHGLTKNDVVIRICCDNPIHSFKVVDFVVAEFDKLGVDYFSNSNRDPEYLEDGFDVEVVKFEALSIAWKEAKLHSEREHVMPYIKNSGRFTLGWRKAHQDYTFKLSVDTENDLEVARTIFHRLQKSPDFSIDEVVNLLRDEPEILAINSESKINSGYEKSLREDRRIDQ
ncbi:MAG: cytidylyltransferase domain-containing protein [Flavobacteriales bacterium]